MDLSKYTPTELLKFVNDLKDNYNNIKNDITIKVDSIEQLKNEINELIIELNDIEELHQKITEELQNRK